MSRFCPPLPRCVLLWSRCPTPCPPLVLLLSFSCPPLVLLLSPSSPPLVLLLSFSCPSFVLLLSSSCPPFVLLLSSSCCPLVLLLPYSCPPVVPYCLVWRLGGKRQFYYLVVCSCCFPSLILLSFVVLLVSSSGLSVALLLSHCLRCFPRQGCGRPRQQQFLPTELFGVYAGIFLHCLIMFCLLL